MKELKLDEVKSLKKGDKVILRSSLLPYITADYIGTVVQNTKSFVSLEVKVIRETLPAGQSYGEPSPYGYAVHFADVGKSDHVFAA